MTTLPLSERHRPRTLDGVIGQSKAVERVRAWLANGIGGRSYWFSGPSSSGKTTLARIMGAHVAEPIYVTEVVGRKVSADFLDSFERDCHLYALGKGGRVWIVNEAHGLSKLAIERFLDLLEPGNLPAHCTVIFTTTWAGESLFEDSIDATPFASRVKSVSLTNQGLAKAWAPALRQIAQLEGLDGQELPAYVELMRKHKNNPRACLSDIEDGCMKAGA